jgi:hypothetical protein
MLEFFRNLFGRYTPVILLGIIAVLFVVMIVFGLSFG